MTLPLQVVPSEVGQNLPFYFPFLHSYWRESFNGDSTSTRKPLDGGEPASHPLRSAASEECSVAVSIQGLTKIYATSGGGQKHALDGLSLDMYQGHVTALLGELSLVSLTCSC